MIYCFPDIETTGLDPKEDFILEVAWAITDEHFNFISDPQSYIVEPTDWYTVFNRLSGAPKVVRDMHEESGLMAAIKSPESTFLPLYRIYDRMVLDITRARRFGGEQTHLAGMSVGFDREFLAAHGFDDLFTGGRPLFHHRILDISSLKLMFGSAGVGYKRASNIGPHRALNDVIEGIDQARIFMDYVRGISHPAVPEAV